jgi:twitching motility protein PilT
VGNKELISLFKAAKWAKPEDLETFLLSAGEITPPELLKMLEIIGAKTALSEPNHKQQLIAFGRLAEGNTHKSLFVPYVKAFTTKDAALRQLLGNLIPKVNNIGEHGELVNLLRSADVPLRQATASVLRKIGGKTVFQLLSDRLGETEFAGRVEAIDVLAQTAGHYAIPSLQHAIAAGKVPEKLHALKYLGDPKFVGKDTTTALKVLTGVLSDPSEQVVVRAIGCFGALCTEDEWFETLLPSLDASNVNMVRAAVDSLRRFGSPRVVTALERKMRVGPNLIRFAVLDTLMAIGTDEVLPALVEALGHKQVVIRTRAGEVIAELSKLGKLDLSRTVIWLLRSRDDNVRRMAVELARSVKDPDGNLWPKLLACLRDEDWWVRERVVDALVEMAGKQMTRHVVAYLGDPSDVVRRYAIDVLIRIKDPQALGALVRVVNNDPDWWAKEKAIEAISAINDERAVPYLADAMQVNPELRIPVLDALGKLNARSATQQVCAQLNDPEPDVRYAALECLKVFNDPSLVESIRPLAQDPEIRIKNAARALLMRWNIEVGAAPAVEGATSTLDRLLIAMAQSQCDDLILASGRQAMVKRLNRTVPLVRNVFTSDQVKALIHPLLTPAQLNELQAMRDVDLSYAIKSEGLRFRANVFTHSGGLAAVFRIIKGKLPSLEELQLPPSIMGLGDLGNGLVLVGGPTGSGKSTTLAALIDYINRTQGKHIISLEDPIEVMHSRVKSLVTQREIGTHTRSFNSALRSTLREDPDVILVGEMRDLATISFAVSAAETGHLVFGTIHTVAADTSIDRLINTFPGGAQDQVRSMLSASLRAVVCQYLLRKRDTEGRRLALEVMINNEAISSLIRKGKCYQIPSVIATGKDQGMQSMDNDLLRLVKEGAIFPDEAYMKARSKKEFESFLDGGVPKAPEAAKAPPAGPAAAPAAAGAPTAVTAKVG